MSKLSPFIVPQVVSSVHFDARRQWMDWAYDRHQHLLPFDGMDSGRLLQMPLPMKPVDLSGFVALGVPMKNKEDE